MSGLATLTGHFVQRPVILSWNDAGLAVMRDSNRDGIYLRTKEALQLLACSPAVQFRFLPHVCVGDELALDFDHWREVMIHNFYSELTSEQSASLAAIDEFFSRFSSLLSSGRHRGTL